MDPDPSLLRASSPSPIATAASKYYFDGRYDEAMTILKKNQTNVRSLHNEFIAAYMIAEKSPTVVEKLIQAFTHLGSTLRPEELSRDYSVLLFNIALCYYQVKSYRDCLSALFSELEFSNLTPSLTIRSLLLLLDCCLKEWVLPRKLILGLVAECERHFAKLKGPDSQVREDSQWFYGLRALTFAYNLSQRNYFASCLIDKRELRLINLTVRMSLVETFHSRLYNGKVHYLQRNFSQALINLNGARETYEEMKTSQEGSQQERELLATLFHRYFYHNLAVISLAQEKYALSTSYLATALREDMIYPSNRATSSSRVVLTQYTRPSFLYRSALSLLLRGKAAQAFSVFQSLIPHYVKNPLFWFRLGECTIAHFLKKRKKIQRKKGKSSKADSSKTHTYPATFSFSEEGSSTTSPPSGDFLFPQPPATPAPEAIPPKDAISWKNPSIGLSYGYACIRNSLHLYGLFGRSFKATKESQDNESEDGDLDENLGVDIRDLGKAGERMMEEGERKLEREKSDRKGNSKQNKKKEEESEEGDVFGRHTYTNEQYDSAWFQWRDTRRDRCAQGIFNAQVHLAWISLQLQDPVCAADHALFALQSNASTNDRSQCRVLAVLYYTEAKLKLGEYSAAFDCLHQYIAEYLDKDVEILSDPAYSSPTRETPPNAPSRDKVHYSKDLTPVNVRIALYVNLATASILMKDTARAQQYADKASDINADASSSLPFLLQTYLSLANNDVERALKVVQEKRYASHAHLVTIQQPTIS